MAVDERKAKKKLGRAFGALKRCAPGAALVEHPTRALFLVNAGRVCGVEYGALHDYLSGIIVAAASSSRCNGEQTSVELYAQEASAPYALAVLPSANYALSVKAELHGKHWMGTGPVIYVGFLDGEHLDDAIVTQRCQSVSNEPDGLSLTEDFICEMKERELCEWIDSLDAAGSLKHRRVFHFGYEFLYATNSCNLMESAVPQIPPKINTLIDAVCSSNPGINFRPDQVTINVYEPGQGIASHVDSHNAFEDAIIMLSLGSDIVMEFNDVRNGCAHFRILPRRSLCVLTDDARYFWKHGISCRKHDVLPQSNRVVRRGKRYSITMRAARKTDRPSCSCGNSAVCDSQKPNDEKSVLSPAELERVHVRDVYDRIAGHFAKTRERALWPAVVDFLDSLPPEYLVLDAGCGSGKYLRERDGENLVKIGCDSSSTLVEIASQNPAIECGTVLVADCLNLPVSNERFDAAICVAVLHHFSTESRRRRCIESLLSCIKPNGLMLVTVWAMDQCRNGQKSTYLHWGKGKKGDCDETADLNGEMLSVHKNLTEFKEQDLFVPWVKSGKFVQEQGEDFGSTFLRFYHVFKEGEMENLIASVPCCQLDKCFYEQGNWCAVVRKL